MGWVGQVEAAVDGDFHLPFFEERQNFESDMESDVDLDVVWCMYVACMSHVCRLYGACILHVCCMYGAEHVCCMYTHVWCMYVACLSHVWCM